MVFKKDLLLIILYSVLALVFVSLNNTYQLTYKFFGKFLKVDQATYGSGNTFKNPGFLIHIVVFALLIGVPMLSNK